MRRLYENLGTSLYSTFRRYTIEEIATLLQEPISTIYNDINIRLEQVNPAYKEEVAAIMRKRSNQNLIPKQRKKD